MKSRRKYSDSIFGMKVCTAWLIVYAANVVGASSAFDGAAPLDLLARAWFGVSLSFFFLTMAFLLGEIWTLRNLSSQNPVFFLAIFFMFYGLIMGFVAYYLTGRLLMALICGSLAITSPIYCGAAWLLLRYARIRIGKMKRLITTGRTSLAWEYRMVVPGALRGIFRHIATASVDDEDDSIQIVVGGDHA